MEEIKYSYYPYRLLFKYPFRINHLQRDGTDNVYLLLTSGNNFGWGECVFIPYYTETIHDFKKIISEIKLPNDTNQIEYYIQSIKRKFPKNQFCIAAIDIALHNLHANITNQSIAALYRIEGKADETSFTIGISSNEEMEKKLNENNDQSYFKLKVNQEEISRIVTCYQNLSTKNFTVDANQGFNDREEALAWSYKLADAQV